MRQTTAVNQAPRPKKKMMNPGMNNSSRNITRPIKNQKISGLEKKVSFIAVSLNS